MANHGIIILLATIAVLLICLLGWQTLKASYTYSKGFEDATTQCNELIRQLNPVMGQSPLGNLSFSNFTPITD